MRSYQRSKHVDNTINTAPLEAAGITEEQAEAMYRYLAIANYEDRFVIPTTHEEYMQEDVYSYQGLLGFSPGNPSSTGESGFSLFPSRRTANEVPIKFVPRPTQKDKV
jgi:nitrate reductase beta subunit